MCGRPGAVRGGEEGVPGWVMAAAVLPGGGAGAEGAAQPGWLREPGLAAAGAQGFGFPQDARKAAR